MTALPVRTLLTGLIDYAGLFPPAVLSMGEAVANYHDYRESADAWALARLVVPVVRLDEFVVAMNATPARCASPRRALPGAAIRSPRQNWPKTAPALR